MKNEMLGAFTENAAPDGSNRRSTMRSIVLTTLLLWAALVILLAAKGTFIGSAGSPPIGIFLGFAIPLAVFMTAYYGWKPFQSFILSVDLRLVVAIEAWRWGGLGFLTFYAKGILPALFAFPAGLGDMAIGVSAPWILLRLIRQPSFATSQRFRVWNILGIVDFIVALSMGTLCSGAFPAITRLVGTVTTSAMAQLPLVLIPVFMVPFFTMLHLTALFQSRQLKPAVASRG